uniref:Rod shape-determining protein MreD n=1 Tax=uncultured bacterium fosmid pJB71G8 TaxID=1478068 RepID=A0A0H3U7P3_9BACT|nr:hypothetical protein [uncultured bacterium fosmid pJB71G8]
MNRTITQLIWLTIVLTLLQVVCNKIILFNVATPIIFIYVLLRLPMNMPKVWVFTIAFALGLTIDIFGNTPGMNALSCTLASSVRMPVFYLYALREDEMKTVVPSITTLGVGNYFKYMSTMVLIYCTLLFFIQAFTLHNAILTVERLLCSSVLSVALLMGIDSLVSTKREKRL